MLVTLVMGKRNKRKKGSSDGGSERDSKKTNCGRGPSRGEPDLSVSEILNQTNSILYDESELSSISNDNVFLNLPIESKDDISCSRSSNMATSNHDSNKPKQSAEPSLKDVMLCLKGIEGKISNMDKRLDALEEVKQKVDRFDIEIKKLWVALEDKNRKVSERITVVEDKVESSDFSIGLLSDKVVNLQKEKGKLKDDITYLQSQSMRSNLLFSNIPEVGSGFVEDAEETVRQFLVDKMKIAQETVDRMKMERVHRIGPKQKDKCRKIVAKFLEYKDKEYVRKQWKALDGTPFYVNEQFPREVEEKRRKLRPRVKEAKSQGKQAWIAYDTLYIDGKAVKD